MKTIKSFPDICLFGEFDGLKVDTITYDTHLLFDRYDNWIGFEVFDRLPDGKDRSYLSSIYLFSKGKEMLRMSKIEFSPV